jgi:tight adherence protein B
MVLLISGFILTVMLTFSLVIVLMRQSASQRAGGKRMALIRPSAQGGTGGDAIQLLKISETSRLDWAEDLLGRYPLLRALQLYVAQGASSATITKLALNSLGLFLLGYLVTLCFTTFFLLNAIVAVGFAAIPYAILSFKRSRRINSFNAALAESIDMLARALRAGYSMAGAIEMLSQNAPEPAAAEFGEVFKQQNLGLPMREALLQLLARVPSLDLRVLVTAILVQKDTGGNLAEILDRTVFVIRDRLRIQGEIRTHTAQGRLTGWILSALPIIMLALTNILNPGYSSVLLHDPTGQKLLYACVAMLSIGTFIIHRIVNGIEV